MFDDNFETLETRWLVSPSDAYAHDDELNRLTLEHNNTDRSTNALFEVPTEEDDLLLQVHADYVPTHLGDEGGIVVWKNALEKVEFLESEDSLQSGEYSIWRAVKKQNLWTFFAHKNNSWELFDSTVCVDPTMAGVVLKGIDREGYVPLNIDKVILCRGSKVSVGNVNSQYKVELVDDQGETVNSQVVPDGFSGVDLELPSIPFRGKLIVYDKDENGNYYKVNEQEEYTDLYGGDVYILGTELTVLWNGEELSEVNPTHLGSLKQDEIEEKMTLLNKSTGNVAENIQVSVAVYEEQFGWRWCDLAVDNEGQPEVYEDTTISMGTLFAGESRDFWVKVVKQDTETGEEIRQRMKPTHFFLNVTND